MKPNLTKETYKFIGETSLWIDVEISYDDNFYLKTNFDNARMVDRHSIKEYTEYLNLNRIAFDFGVEKCKEKIHQK